jgi:hypothetical protein
MRRFTSTALVATLALVGVAFFTGPAQAQHGHNHRHYYGHIHNSNDPFHQHLDYRYHQRQAYSNYAHQFPMTHWQHRQLHNYLDNQARYDRALDRQYHRQNDYYYTPYNSGYYYQQPSYYYQQPAVNFGIRTPNFSFSFGR